MTYDDLEEAVNAANGQYFTNIYQTADTPEEEWETYYEKQVIQKIINDAGDVIEYVVKAEKTIEGKVVEFYEVVIPEDTAVGYALRTVDSELWKYGTYVLTAIKDTGAAVGTATYTGLLAVDNATWSAFNNWWDYIGGSLIKVTNGYIPCLYDVSKKQCYAPGEFVQMVHNSVGSLLEDQYSIGEGIDIQSWGQIAYYQTVTAHLYCKYWEYSSWTKEWSVRGSAEILMNETIVDLTHACFMVFHYTYRKTKYQRYVFLSANKPCVLLNDAIQDRAGYGEFVSTESGCVVTIRVRTYLYRNSQWMLDWAEDPVTISLTQQRTAGGALNRGPHPEEPPDPNQDYAYNECEGSTILNEFTVYTAKISNTITKYIPFEADDNYRAGNTIYEITNIQGPLGTSDGWTNESGPRVPQIKKFFIEYPNRIKYYLAATAVAERQLKVGWGHLGGMAHNTDLPEPLVIPKPDGTPDPWYPISVPSTTWDTDEPVSDDTPSIIDTDVIPPSIEPIPNIVDRDPGPGPGPDPGGDPVIVTPGSGTVPVPPANEPNDDLGFCAIWRMTPAYLETFCQWLWSPNFVDQVLAYFTSPNDAIVGVHKIYWTPTYETAMKEIRCGYLNSNCNGWPVSQRYNTIDCGTVKLDEVYGNIYDYADTEVIIYLPYIGFIPLDLSLCMRGTIGVKYVLDVVSGAGVCQISVTRDGLENHIASYGCSCASPIPISSGNYIAIVQSVATAAAQAIEGVGGLVNSKAFAKMNDLGKAGQITGLAEGTLSALDGAKTHVQLSGRFSSQVGDMDNKKPYLIIKRPNAIPAQTSYDFIGKPSRQVATLSTLSGFNQVTRIHPANVGNMTEDELNELEELFASGVIM